MNWINTVLLPIYSQMLQATCLIYGERKEYLSQQFISPKFLGFQIPSSSFSFNCSLPCPWIGPVIRLLCVLSLSRVWPFATLWTVAHLAPLSMGSSQQEYWSGLPFPPLGDLPTPRIKPMATRFSWLAGGFFTAVMIDLIYQKCLTFEISVPSINSNPKLFFSSLLTLVIITIPIQF